MCLQSVLLASLFLFVHSEYPTSIKPSAVDITDGYSNAHTFLRIQVKMIHSMTITLFEVKCISMLCVTILSLPLTYIKFDISSTVIFALQPLYM
ncbi:hypothetical protein BDB01DRAFT_810915 [Pilobolus umbonatus]|nr:hypothetical protein BDB01DRAFT_810874 [Pilobolus umbonatus]KAI8972119.1 hypothetical protein BDB01DRAFT_810915 [Pilobolus umbonatus]